MTEQQQPGGKATCATCEHVRAFDAPWDWIFKCGNMDVQRMITGLDFPAAFRQDPWLPWVDADFYCNRYRPRAADECARG